MFGKGNIAWLFRSANFDRLVALISFGSDAFTLLRSACAFSALPKTNGLTREIYSLYPATVHLVVGKWRFDEPSRNQYILLGR